MTVSDSALDGLILENVYAKFLKVAMVISRVERAAEDADLSATAEQIASRIAALAAAGRIEVAGNLSNWRHSEIRLPASE